MKKYLILSILIILNFISVSAQFDSTNKDELFKSDSMTDTFEKLGKNHLIDLYGFDENSERLIRAHFYFNRLRFEIISGTIFLPLSLYGASVFIPIVITAKQDYKFIATILSVGLLATAAYEGYSIYEGIEAQKFAGKKSNLYNRLRNYYLTKKLTEQDQKIIDKHKRRYIPFLYEDTGLIKR